MSIENVLKMGGRMPEWLGLPTPPPVVRRVLRTTWRGVEDTAWAVSKTVVRMPKTAALVTGAAVVSEYASLADAAIAVSAVIAVQTASPESRVRLSSLTSLYKRHKRVRGVKRRYARVLRDAGLTKPGVHSDSKRVPRRLGVHTTPVGVAVTMDVGRLSMDLDAVKSRGSILASAFRAREIEYTEPTPGVARMHLVMDDPFERQLSYLDLPPATKPLHVVVGLGAMGESIERPLYLPTLIVGSQGAGKSSESWTWLRALQDARIPHRVRVFDPKGGQEFGELEGCAYAYQHNPLKWDAFLSDAWRALEARQASLRERGLRKAPVTDDEPLDVMVIDELLTVMALANTKAKVRVAGEPLSVGDAFKLYLSQARSAGHTVVALSQLGQKADLGSIADLFSNKTCLRCASDDLVRVVGFDPKLYPAHEIPAREETAGIGYTEDSMGRVVKYRSAFQSDRERTMIAERMKKDSERYWAMKKGSNK